MTKKQLQDKIKSIKALVMDVDGVLTDGGMYYSETGDEVKKFNTKDAQGIELLMKKGFLVAIITKEKTQIVERRARKMKVADLFQGVENKLIVLKEYASTNHTALDQIAYIGDDINDLSILREVGLPIAVRDAISDVKEVAQYVTKARGGAGAVREVCDLFLRNE